jgi:CheY-like chemotaxis protein
MSKERYDSSRRVLVVSHDEPLSGFIARILNNVGCASVTALDGFEARKLFQSDWYFVGIIVDSRIRNPTGPTLVREIRSQKVLRRIPVIVIASSWTSAEANECFSAGAASIIPLGFTETQLQSVIATVIGEKTKKVFE